MIALYPLSLFYIVLSIVLLLFKVKKKETEKFKEFYLIFIKREKIRKIVFIIGLVLSILSLLFPFYPGPIILGDLVIALSLIFSSFFIKSLTEDKEEESVKKYSRYLVTLSIVFIIHLIFPYLVLL